MASSKLLLAAVATTALLTGALLRADGWTTPFQPFTDRVETVADVASDCGKGTSTFADRFTQATGAQNVGVACDSRKVITEAGIDYPIDTLMVSYSAPYQLVSQKITMAGAGTDGFAFPGTPLFSTYAACVDQLGKQRTAFESTTGRLALAGQCTASNDATQPGYSLTIETYSKIPASPSLPNEAAVGFTAYFAHNPGDTDSYAKDVNDVMAAGITATGQATIAYQDDTHVFFYSDTLFWSDLLPPATLGTYADAIECGDSDQQNTAVQIFARDAIVPGIGRYGVKALCEPDTNPDTGKQDAWKLVVPGVGTWLPTEDVGQDLYDTRKNCSDDVARVKSNYESNSKVFFGMICEPAWDTWHGGQAGKYEGHVFFDDAAAVLPATNLGGSAPQARRMMAPPPPPPAAPVAATQAAATPNKPSKWSRVKQFLAKIFE